jgi:hypothetical protein
VAWRAPAVTSAVNCRTSCGVWRRPIAAAACPRRRAGISFRALPRPGPDRRTRSGPPFAADASAACSTTCSAPSSSPSRRRRAHGVGSGRAGPGARGAAVRALVRSGAAVDDPALEVERFGVRFPNPVGLAAGFDKTRRAVQRAGGARLRLRGDRHRHRARSAGNPRPASSASPPTARCSTAWASTTPAPRPSPAAASSTPIEPVLGINLGKSKVTPLEEAAGDYLRSLELLEPFARYLVVNVSSPNTPGLRAAAGRRPAARPAARARRPRARAGAPRAATRRSRSCSRSPPTSPTRRWRRRPGSRWRRAPRGSSPPTPPSRARGCARRARAWRRWARAGSAARRSGPGRARWCRGCGRRRAAGADRGRGRRLHRRTTRGRWCARGRRWCSSTRASSTAARWWRARSAAGCCAACARGDALAGRGRGKRAPVRPAHRALPARLAPPARDGLVRRGGDHRGRGRPREATLVPPAGGGERPGWVVLHGLTVHGRRHPAMQRFVRSLAASGAVVLVPDVPEWTRAAAGPRRRARDAAPPGWCTWPRSPACARGAWARWASRSGPRRC